MELGVIGVLMASDAMGRHDVSDWTAIHGKQQRTEYRSLGYSVRWMKLIWFDLKAACDS